MNGGNIMKRLAAIMVLFASAALYGSGFERITKEGDYCTFRDRPETDFYYDYNNEPVYHNQMNDATCHMPLNMWEYNEDGDISYLEGQELEHSFPLRLAFRKKVDLSGVKRVEFGEGVKIEGISHRGGLIDAGVVIKYTISNGVLRIMENDLYD